MLEGDAGSNTTLLFNYIGQVPPGRLAPQQVSELLSLREVTTIVQYLRRLVDELRPLLKDEMEDLPPQQRKILHALMEKGGTAQPTDLAGPTRLPLNAITAQLKRLKDALRLLRGLASPEMKEAWPTAWRSLVETLKPEAAAAIRFLEPVCNVLEGKDRSLLDALPPEQREFAVEVLARFEPKTKDAPPKSRK